jgi:hypothetical protein
MKRTLKKKNHRHAWPGGLSDSLPRKDGIPPMRKWERSSLGSSAGLRRKVEAFPVFTENVENFLSLAP